MDVITDIAFLSCIEKVLVKCLLVCRVCRAQ